MKIDEGLIDYNSDDVNRSLKNHYKKKYRLSITLGDKELFIHHNQQSDVQDFIELFDETDGVEENLCMETVKPFTLRIMEEK